MRLFPEFWSDALIEQLVYNLPTLKNDIKTGNSKAIANYFENSEGVIGDVKTKNQKLIHAIIIMISKEIHGIEVSKLQQKIKENELLKDIALQLSPETLIIFLNCLFNELRYANKLTLFFHFAIFRIFTMSQNEYIEEQIAKILLERII